MVWHPVFTFNLCSLEPCEEDAHSLLALADPSPEQARYQRVPGNARFETSYEEQQKKVAERATGEYHRNILQNIFHHTKYSYSLVVCQLFFQMKIPFVPLQIM